MPKSGRGPGLLIVGGKPEDTHWFSERGAVACVVGEGGPWEPARDQMRENPCVDGEPMIWRNAMVWVEGEDAEPALAREEVLAYLERRLAKNRA
jgi:hypothetical protein